MSETKTYPSKLRAKFRVSEVADLTYGQGKGAERVKASTVYSDSGENADFFKASPSGDFTIQIDNPSAWGFFQVGEDYYFDFSSAKVAPVVVEAAPAPAEAVAAS